MVPKNNLKSNQFAIVLPAITGKKTQKKKGDASSLELFIRIATHKSLK